MALDPKQVAIDDGPSLSDLLASLGFGNWSDDKYWSRNGERAVVTFRLKNSGPVFCVMDMLKRNKESNKEWFFEGCNVQSQEGRRKKIKGFYSLHDRTGWIQWD